MGRFLSIPVILIISLVQYACSDETVEITWPETSITTKPWTRWWWHGSAVTREGITNELEELQIAGIGGVEITPIYGVIGEEKNFIDYLSPEWMEMLDHTLAEAERLGMGVDMATGTGWPFGGPWIGSEHAPSNILHKTYSIKNNQSLQEPVKYEQEPLLRAVPNQLYQLYGIYRVAGEEITGSVEAPEPIDPNKVPDISQLKYPVSSNENLQVLALDQVKFRKELPLIALMGYSGSGETIDLLDLVDENGWLDWQASGGDWILYAVFQGNHGKMVERAAPGGEGNTIDHFSEKALQTYLSRFDSAFAGHDLQYLRAFFNDSYEVDDASGSADWTPEFFREFQIRRGYDLRDQLPAFFGNDLEEKNRRVLCDYRETIGELILENFTEPWNDWAGTKDAIARNQSHGSPGNILDIYAANGIPETEGTDLVSIKLASSAANITVKKLSSSESATWLNEHFTSSLSDIKGNIDRYLLGGINHVFYHGTCYSPARDDWPGRLFYAAIHANSRNSWWDHFATLNQYIERVQSFMQSGKPANQILLYLPIYDMYSTPSTENLMHFDLGRGAWDTSVVKKTGQWLIENGFTFDFISDRQLQNLETSNGSIRSQSNEYQAVVIPGCELIPLATMEKLLSLARNGVPVIFQGALPQDVPGWFKLEERRSALKSLLSTEGSNFRISRNLREDLELSDVYPEEMVRNGLKFLKRAYKDGSIYFILNDEAQRLNQYIQLATTANSAVLLDPMSGNIGKAIMDDHGVLLQLNPGESCLVVTSNNSVSNHPYPYYETSGQSIPIDGRWNVSFLQGGPGLPPPQSLEAVGSWTNLDGEELKRFSGIASYQTTLPGPGTAADAWLLDLGDVRQSAKVILNQEPLATVIGPVYTVLIDSKLLSEENTLEVQVANLMANRIAYMDQQKKFWKKFYNVNFPARLAENRVDGLFNAADWAPLPSGLLGPVTLTALKKKEK